MRKTFLILMLSFLARGAAAQGDDLYAKPQQRIQLQNGSAINLVCTGQGSPTVILTSGAGDWSVNWQKVQAPLSARTRVCAWDRPGLGFSDGNSQRLTAAVMASDLGKTLAGAAIAGPYILVAHSSGTYETLAFADIHRRDVAGLVLVDPSLPSMPKRIEAVSPLAARFLRADFANRAAAFHHCAADPAHVSPADAAICFHIPESARSVAAVIAPLNHQPQRMATLATMYEDFEANADAVARVQGFGAVPIAVLTSESQPLAALPTEQPERAKALGDLWRSAHDELAALSSNGSNVIVPGSQHPIPWEHPEAVVSAVLKVLDTVQRRQ